MNATTATARRIIARAKHTHPTTGKRCATAVSCVREQGREPTTPGFSRWFYLADGVEAPVLHTVDRATHVGWVWDDASCELAWLGPCPGCGQRKLLRGQAVRGRQNPRKECDARCEAAVGPSCDCSCGGMNHGSAH